MDYRRYIGDTDHEAEDLDKVNIFIFEWLMADKWLSDGRLVWWTRGFQDPETGGSQDASRTGGYLWCGMQCEVSGKRLHHHNEEESMGESESLRCLGGTIPSLIWHPEWIKVAQAKTIAWCPVKMSEIHILLSTDLLKLLRPGNSLHFIRLLPLLTRICVNRWVTLPKYFWF